MKSEKPCFNKSLDSLRSRHDKAVVVVQMRVVVGLIRPLISILEDSASDSTSLIEVLDSWSSSCSSLRSKVTVSS